MVVIISWVLLFLVCIILWIIVLPVKLFRIASIFFYPIVHTLYLITHVFRFNVSFRLLNLN